VLKTFQRLLRWSIAGWFLFFATCVGNAATNSTRFYVEVWGTKEGLPQNSVITMIQTRDGYLWFGTLNGIVRFDGNQFTVFDESNTPGLNSSRIVKLFEDSKKNLWIGTETAGAALVKGGKITSLDLGQGRREGQLVSACEDSIGGVWLYTKDGELGRYKDGKVDVWHLQTGFSQRAVIAEKSGRIWIGQDQILFSIDPKQVRNSEGLPREEVVRIGKLDFLLASKTGGQWRLADGVVQKWVENKLERSWNYPWPNGTTVQAACEDQDGNLIVGTRLQGLFWFDENGNVRHLTKADGLSYNSVLSLHADNEGSLWVGTDGGGLNRVKRQVFTMLGASIGLTVQSVAEEKDGGLWFSSNEEGVGFYKGGVLKNLESNMGALNRFAVHPLLLDHNQKLWAGTFLGLFWLENEIFQRPPGANILNQFVSALHEDRKGNIWAGTQGGLGKWDGHDWKTFSTSDGLSANIVRAIADDAEGNLWIGTERGGLNCLCDGKFIAYQQTNGFPSDNISSLYVDAENVLWIGTLGSGLVRFHHEKWTHYTARDGLISNGIDYLTEDNQGCLWIGSNRGVMRVPKKALNDFANGTANFIPCRGFGKADGLPASECTSDSQPAACRTHDGILWFPTIAGLASVDPAQFHANTNPPRVLIESVLIERQELNRNSLLFKLPETIVIPPGKEHLEIEYSSLNLAAPNSARFKYRLQGHEKDWNDVGNRHVASYTKLSPGNYTFEVTACNEDGVWNETGASIAIVVQPPFWRTWWFITVATLALLGMIVGIVHFISTQKLQRELATLRQQEALEKERARIARDIHDQVGASLTQVSLLGEMIESDKNFPDEIESHAKQISQTARETSHALDEIVWTVNPSNDTLDGLINYICKNAQEYLSVAGLRYRLEIPADLPRKTISPEARHNVFLAAKEAVTNIVRHAKASEVWIRLQLEPRSFTLKIEDNGRGPGDIHSEAAQARNGLSNMRKRMEDIGGKFSIAARLEGGTIVALTVPIGNS
jgi:ligand-binding sensor domain-containing protein/signal transduction histidine kinase